MKPEGQGDAMWNNLQRSVENAEAEPIRIADVPSSDAEEHAAASPPRHEDVKQRVRELIGKYPTVRSQQLYDLAVRMHPELEEGGLRSFHARYVLPIKREVARAEGRLQPRARKSEPPQRRARRQRGTAPHEPQPSAAPSPGTDHGGDARARVRAVLMRLSRELVNAETRADVVDVLARMEDVVDEVIAAMTTASKPRTDES